MTLIVCTDSAALARPTVTLGRPWPGRAILRRHLRNIVLAAALSLPAALALNADEAPQAWVPQVLDMPGDMDMQTDRAIGSTLRMFSFSTGADPDALLAAWEEALRTGGYAILQSQDDLLDRSIEFSGQGVANAKIVISTPATRDRHLVEVDATLQ